MITFLIKLFDSMEQLLGNVEPEYNVLRQY